MDINRTSRLYRFSNIPVARIPVHTGFLEWQIHVIQRLFWEMSKLSVCRKSKVRIYRGGPKSVYVWTVAIGPILLSPTPNDLIEWFITGWPKLFQPPKINNHQDNLTSTHSKNYSSLNHSNFIQQNNNDLFSIIYVTFILKIGVPQFVLSKSRF